MGGKKQRAGKLVTLDPQLSQQAHIYALINSDCRKIDDYIEEHEILFNSRRKKKARTSSKWSLEQTRNIEFAAWLKDKANEDNVPDYIFWLAKGPSPTAKRYKGYQVNGYMFYTKSRDEKCTTQNSGVSLSSVTSSFASSKDKNPIEGNVTYYGSILEILELDYWSQFSVVLFRCEWYQVEKDEYGLTSVRTNKFCSTNDPFVMPLQVHQVFYIPDPVIDGLQYVMNRVPRDLYDFEGRKGALDENNYWKEPGDLGFGSEARPEIDVPSLSRDDMAPMIIDAATNFVDLQDSCDQNGDEEDVDDTLWDWMEPEEDNNDESMANDEEFLL